METSWWCPIPSELTSQIGGKVSPVYVIYVFWHFLHNKNSFLHFIWSIRWNFTRCGFKQENLKLSDYTSNFYLYFSSRFYLNMRKGDPCIFAITRWSQGTLSSHISRCSNTTRRMTFSLFQQKNKPVIVYYHVFTKYTPCFFVRHMHTFVTFHSRWPLSSVLLFVVEKCWKKPDKNIQIQKLWMGESEKRGAVNVHYMFWCNIRSTGNMLYFAVKKKNPYLI